MGESRTCQSMEELAEREPRLGWKRMVDEMDVMSSVKPGGKESGRARLRRNTLNI